MPTSSAESSGSNVPAFLSKLWRLVEDPKYDSIISWSSSGQSFTIHDQTQFAKDVLPLYFKHNNMASFIRQLNMYGFRKVVNVDSGGLKGYKEDIEFYHNFFIRGQEATLEFIKRKAPGHQKLPSSNTPAISAVPHDQELRTELVRELLTDVNQLQGKQVQVDSQLGEMKQENEALWREVAVLRRKHLKQQQIVEKLIRFLASLVHQARGGNPENNISMKRKHTLMIDEGCKMRKTLIGAVAPARQAAPSETRIAEHENGPIIKDITETHPGSPGFGNLLSRGGKGNALTIAPANATPSQIVEELISSTDPETDLADEVVLCENLFDDEVDLAPSVKHEANSTIFQAPTQKPQQPTTAALALQRQSQPQELQGPQEQQQQQQQQLSLQDFDKFDLEQTLNTPRIEDWEEQSPTPGTSSKLTSERVTSTSAAQGLQIALQTPSKGGYKVENPTSSKNKDALTGSKSSLAEDSPPRLHSKAMTEWQGDRHVSIAQKLSSLLNDHFIGTDQIKRIAEDTNRPPDVLHDHLEGVETELDWLQDQLLAGGLNIDSNTLMNIFNTDGVGFGDDNNGANSNSQVVSYQSPSFLDMMDDPDDEDNLKQLKA